MLVDERPVVLHQGRYKRTATLGEAVFLITGMTIGAGVLGLPYVVAQVGLLVGGVYIVALGIVMLLLNLMIGEVVARTNEPLQLPGLAGKYLGSWGKDVLSITFLFTSVGALLAYIIGEGSALSALLGGNTLLYSLVFWAVGSIFIAGGLEYIKKVEGIFSLVVMLMLVGLSAYALSKTSVLPWQEVHITNLFLPYGVILFALRAAPAIAEAEAVLPGDPAKFKKALIIGTLLPVALYVLFAVAVARVTSHATTEVATVGLGQKFGPTIRIAGNFFAALAMCTAYLGLGTALKDTLVWDFKFKRWLAMAVVALAPIILFILGAHNFIAILDVVGGVFIGFEAIIMVLIYWQARKKGDIAPAQFQLRHIWLITVPVILIFSILTVVSVFKVFK